MLAEGERAPRPPARASWDVPLMGRRHSHPSVNIERQVHVLRAKAPLPPSIPSIGNPPILGEDDFEAPRDEGGLG